MRLVFAGTPQASVPSLQALLDSPHDVVAVVTRPDAPKGRGRSLSRAPIGELADEHGIPVLTPTPATFPDFVDQLRSLEPDCAPIVAFGALLPTAVLAVPRLGWVNLHFSLLPAWRGAAPVQRAILAGDAITGATTFLLDEGMDTGPVLGMVTEVIGDRDTSGDVLDRLSRSGAELLRATIDGLELDRLTAVPQSSDGVSLAPKLAIDDAMVDWTSPALHIDRLIRACTPAPGAWTTFRGERFKLGPVTVAEGPAGQQSPGELVATKREVLVGTLTGPVVLGEVQPVGKRVMAAADWARGVRVVAGEVLG